ncbi:hypothetical protein MBLNU13_g07792t1 [Cladosporium sp. NU13]
MNAQITHQTRDNLAQQFRQWAMERNVSLAQTEQMVMAMLSGQYDAQMSRNAQPAIPIHHQPNVFGDAALAFGFQTPFGTFSMPAMPPMPLPVVPGTYPAPATVVPTMFPTSGMDLNPILPNTQTTRTSFSGGEAIQQSSSYSGQRGSTTFQYNSSSTSMNFSPSAQHVAQRTPLPPVQYVQQPVLPTMASPQAVPIPVQNMPAPPQPQPYTQRSVETHIFPQSQPQPPPHHVQAPIAELPPMPTPIVEVPPTPEQIFHPIAANQAPQNKRLADSFKRELSEATYFSDIPGMPDRSVQQ